MNKIIKLVIVLSGIAVFILIPKGMQATILIGYGFMALWLRLCEWIFEPSTPTPEENK